MLNLRPPRPSIIWRTTATETTFRLSIGDWHQPRAAGVHPLRRTILGPGAQFSADSVDGGGAMFSADPNAAMLLTASFGMLSPSFRLRLRNAAV